MCSGPNESQPSKIEICYLYLQIRRYSRGTHFQKYQSLVSWIKKLNHTKEQSYFRGYFSQFFLAWQCFNTWLFTCTMALSILQPKYYMELITAAKVSALIKLTVIVFNFAGLSYRCIKRSCEPKNQMFTSFLFENYQQLRNNQT